MALLSADGSKETKVDMRETWKRYESVRLIALIPLSLHSLHYYR
jgi:hypothetical protein